MSNISIQLTKKPRPRPADEDSLGFGTYFTDHMFFADYKKGKDWHNPRIIPYGALSLEPSALCFHYGQEDFEGLKAYHAVDGKMLLFRPQENFRRLNSSNDRLCIPQIDEELALEGLKKLLLIDKDWLPRKEGTSIYIRPFIIATEPKLGVKASDEYMFMIILSPSGAYYREGLNPVKIYVEAEYVRAAKGGLGHVKAGGSYASSLKAQVEAQKQGYSQVLWLDSAQKKYIEEVGTMNIFFIIDGEVVTPELTGTILPGITRKSAIEMLKSWGIGVNERLITLEEIKTAGRNGRIQEAFGTGTAAVISPVGELKCDGEVFSINNGRIGTVSQRLYDNLTGIQTGRIDDPFGWMVEVK